MTDEPTSLTPEPAQVDPKLLELLVCPITKGRLVFNRDAQELLSPKAGLAYPIREGIPIMLPEEARSMTEDEIKSTKVS